MEFEGTGKLTLDTDDIFEMIDDYLRKKGYVRKEDRPISLNSYSSSSGSSNYNDHNYSYSAKIHVEVENKKPKDYQEDNPEKTTPATSNNSLLLTE